jgi:hypothetical protein
MRVLLNGLHATAAMVPPSTAMRLGGASARAESSTKSWGPAPRSRRVRVCGWKRAVVTRVLGGRRRTVGGVSGAEIAPLRLWICTTAAAADARRVESSERARLVMGASCKVNVCATRVWVELRRWIEVPVAYTRASCFARRWEMGVWEVCIWVRALESWL